MIRDDVYQPHPKTGWLQGLKPQGVGQIANVTGGGEEAMMNPDPARVVSRRSFEQGPIAPR